jgi:uroporphyrinogen-III decarboxylase
MEKMTSRERLLAAARGEAVDMIPLSPRVGYAARHHCGSESPQNMLRLKSIYDYDPFLTICGQDIPLSDPFCTFRYAAGVDVDIKVKDEGTRRVIDRTIHTPDGDMHEVRVLANPGRAEYGYAPEPAHREYMVKGREDLVKLQHIIPPVNSGHAAEYHGWEKVAGDEAVTRACIYGPIGYQAGQVMSTEDMMINYLSDREFVVELVDMFREALNAQVRAMLEEGVRYFYSSWYAHSLSVGWSPEIFREWFVPMIKEQAELIHSYDGIFNYYEDGKCMGIVEMLVEAGADVLETCMPPPVGDFDLTEAKRLCEGKMTLMGYVDLIYVLQEGTVEDVRRQVEEACAIGGRGGGFILGTSDSIRERTPIENIDAYFKYGREYGRISE